MNVDLESLVNSLKDLEDKHSRALRGKSGKNADFEEGFIKGLQYVRNYVIPAFETMDLDEASAIEEGMQGEIDDIKARHRFGLSDES